MMKVKLKTNLADTIANILRQEIIGNEIQQGDHFNETALAARFGVSRAPIREALRFLEIEGLAKVLSNGRTIATGFSPDDVAGYFNLRYFVESESIRLILSKPADDAFGHWIRKLDAVIEESRLRLEQDNGEEFVMLDEEFHRSIIKYANFKGYLHVWNTANNLTRSIFDLNRKATRDNRFPDLHRSQILHENILKGLKNRDLDFALRNLRNHVDKGVESYEQLIQQLLTQKQYLP